MAQKTNPISTRFIGTNLWKNVWASSSFTQPVEFGKIWRASHLITRFYQKHGFDIIALRVEKNLENTVFFLSICKNMPERSTRLNSIMKYSTEGLGSGNSIYRFYPHFIKTLPRSVALQKLRVVNNSWLHLNLGGHSSKTKAIMFANFIKKYNIREFSVLLSQLQKVCEQAVILVKSHPSDVLDMMPNAAFLSIYVRQQLLFSIKKKKRVIPLRYFRQIANYLMSRFSGYLRGIRLQIKGRLPKLGGSAGAARSKKQLLSVGYLSTQRLLSPIDYNYVDLGSKSGICSLAVWISYRSPLSEIK